MSFSREQPARECKGRNSTIEYSSEESLEDSSGEEQVFEDSKENINMTENLKQIALAELQPLVATTIYAVVSAAAHTDENITGEAVAACGAFCFLSLWKIRTRHVCAVFCSFEIEKMLKILCDTL